MNAMNNYFNPENKVQQFLNGAGDGLANFNLNGNYTQESVFKYSAPDGFLVHILGVTVGILATGSFEIDEYLPGSALTNGLFFSLKNKNYRLPYIGNIKTLGAYATLGEGAATENTGFFGTTNYAYVELPFAKACGFPLDLNGNEGEEFRVHLQDDFTDADDHFFLVHGWKEALNENV